MKKNEQLVIQQITVASFKNVSANQINVLVNLYLIVYFCEFSSWLNRPNNLSSDIWTKIVL